MKKESGSTWKLGAFVIIGLVLFGATIYFVGKQKNLFGNTIVLQAEFKSVSGLKIGNNIRLSGINVGTIDDIAMSDTSVIVDMVIKKEMQEFIKKDATVSIGSDGLMGDKVLTIKPGMQSVLHVNDGDKLQSTSAIEMEDVMRSLQASIDNAGIITAQLAQFTTKMNNGDGALSRLISDEGLSNSISKTINNLESTSNQFAKFSYTMNNGDGALTKLVKDEAFSRSLDTTMQNLQGATKGLNDNLEAAKNSFLFRGFFKKKAKEEAKIVADKKKLEDLRIQAVDKQE